MGYNPENDPRPIHESHYPARLPDMGQRSESGDAQAFEALERARAVLASHKTAIKTPRWF